MGERRELIAQGGLGFFHPHQDVTIRCCVENVLQGIMDEGVDEIPATGWEKGLSTLTPLPGSRCIVSCMDDREVLVHGVTFYELRDLRDHFYAEMTIPLEEELKPTAHEVASPTWKAYLEQFLNWTVLLPTAGPIAGALGKSGLDILADVVKEWLATQPKDRTVEIYGPDGEVVRIVRMGKEIRTSKQE
jgi:hypothetical protein